MKRKKIVASLLTRGHDRKSLKTRLGKKLLLHLGAKRWRTRSNWAMHVPPWWSHITNETPPLEQWVAELQREVVNSNDRIKKVLPESPFTADRNCKSLKNHFIPKSRFASLDAVAKKIKCVRVKCQIPAASSGNRNF